jgi:hypothetical protein
MVTLRFAFATLCIGLISFSAGNILSFVFAYMIVQPHAKFTGAGAFHLGVVASAWMSICLMLSFLLTVPFYLRIFGRRSLRHLLIYTSFFLVLIGLAQRSPLLSVLVSVSSRILRFITHSEVIALLVLPLQATLVATALFCAAAYLVARFFAPRPIAT